MPREGANLRAGFGVPDPRGSTGAGCRKRLPIGAERHALDMFGVANQPDELLAFPYLPELHGLPGARGQRFVVATERHAADRRLEIVEG